MAPKITKKLVNKRSDPLGTKVLIPNVGEVNLHAGHVSFIKDMTGSACTDFKSILELRKLIDSAKVVVQKRRPGSEAQAFAFFLDLEDVANGCIRVTDPNFEQFAKVWEKFCDTKYRVRGGRELTPYGKSVSRGIYIGKPEKDKNWRAAFTSFPLHTSPCDVCLFLTCLVKTSAGLQNPYGSLDLKNIHDFFQAEFASQIRGVTGSAELVDDMEDPHYDSHSPQPVVVSEEEDDLPLASFVTPKQSVPQEITPVKSKRWVEKRKARFGSEETTAQSSPGPSTSKQVDLAPVGSHLVSVYVPDEIEW